MVGLSAAAVTDAAEAVRRRIADAGGDLSRITLVAVTKGFGPEAVAAAVGSGLVACGENYAQELVTKAAAAELQSVPVRWHFLGRIQRNKVKALAALVDLWQGVDRLDAAQEVARRAPGAAVLVQVNLTGDAGRNGCDWADTPGVVAGARGCGLDVRGLMGVAAPDRDAARAQFRRLRTLADELSLGEVSMGMSDDLEVAVEEGATMVRIGRGLFGARPAGAEARR